MRRGTMPKQGYFVPAGNPTLGGFARGVGIGALRGADELTMGVVPNALGMRPAVDELYASNPAAADIGMKLAYLGGMGAAGRGAASMGRSALQDAANTTVSGRLVRSAQDYGKPFGEAQTPLDVYRSQVYDRQMVPTMEAAQLLRDGFSLQEVQRYIADRHGASDNYVLNDLLNMESMKPRDRKKAIEALKKAAAQAGR